MGALTVAVVVLASFEVGYFVKIIAYGIASKFRSHIHPLQPSKIYGIVTTRDVDLLLNHMNNSRYVRCLDFGRIDHWSRCALYYATKQLNTSILIGSLGVRYRKPVYLFMPYVIQTEIAYWDDKSLYFRQELRTLHDDFIRATNYAQCTLVGSSPIEAMKKASSYTCKKPSNLPPGSEDEYENFLKEHPLPKDLAQFISFNTMSSMRLKATRLVENATNAALDRVCDNEKNQ